MLAPDDAVIRMGGCCEADHHDGRMLPSPAASHCSSSVGSAAAKDPAALKDALRRMERTMVGRKSHHLAEEARRWGRHVPTLANSDVEEVGEILERLARFRTLHASRAGLRRKIGAELGPGPMPPLTRPTRREVQLTQGRAVGRTRAQQVAAPRGRGLDAVVAPPLAGPEAASVGSARRVTEEDALADQLESMNLMRRPQLA